MFGSLSKPSPSERFFTLETENADDDADLDDLLLQPFPPPYPFPLPFPQVGEVVGAAVGAAVGSLVGESVGAAVGGGVVDAITTGVDRMMVSVCSLAVNRTKSTSMVAGRGAEIGCCCPFIQVNRPPTDMFSIR